MNLQVTHHIDLWPMFWPILAIVGVVMLAKLVIIWFGRLGQAINESTDLGMLTDLTRYGDDGRFVDRATARAGTGRKGVD